MTLRRSLVLIAGLALVGCGSQTATPSGSPGTSTAPDVGISGEYAAVGLPAPFDPGDELRLTFGDGEISFQATCNSFSGNARWDDGVLAVDELGGTEMGCPGKGHDQDQWLTEFLAAAPTIDVDGRDVRLTHDGTEIRLVPAAEATTPPASDSDLVGTRWRLVRIEQADGDTVSMTGVGRRRALLTVERGSIGFDTTCNTGGGNAKVVRDQLHLSQVFTTQRACLDDRGEIEKAVLAVLGQPRVDWEITDTRLRLTVGDMSLLYRTAG